MTVDAIEPFLFGGESGALAVFVNGRFRPDLSDLSELPDGVCVSSLAGAIETKCEIVEPHLTRHADYRESAICALNTALFEDGAFVHVDRGIVATQPIHLLFLATGGTRRRPFFLAIFLSPKRIRNRGSS